MYSVIRTHLEQDKFVQCIPSAIIGKYNEKQND